MLNIFGKNYGPDFRTILFCRHLYHRHILGLYDGTNDNLLSHILLIFKYYTYISRQKRILNRDNLIANLIKAKKREEQISLVTSNKREVYIYILLNVRRREGDFFFFIVCMFVWIYLFLFTFLLVLLHSHQIEQNEIIKWLFSQWQSLLLNNNARNVIFKRKNRTRIYFCEINC